MEHSVDSTGANGAAMRKAMGPRRFIPFILVIVLTLAAALTAVLSSGSSAGASTAVRAALDSTMNASSVSFDLNMKLSGSAPASADLSGSCGSGPVCQMAFSAASASSSVGLSHLVLDNGVLYVEFSGVLASKLPTTWVSIPATSAESQPLSGLSQTGGLASVLAHLVKVGDTVTNNGVATLNGVATDEYTVSASQSVEHQQMATVLKALPSADTSVLGAVSVGGYDLNIYVNPDSTVAKFQLTTSIGTVRGSENLSLTLALFNYGSPVSVSVPPTSQVTPLSSIEKNPLTTF